jgi:hypothetical protein
MQPMVLYVMCDYAELVVFTKEVSGSLSESSIRTLPGGV